MANRRVTIEQLRKEFQESQEKIRIKKKEDEEKQREWELQNPDEAILRRIATIKQSRQVAWERMQRARFDFWSRRDRWSMLELAFLLKGKEPIGEDDYGSALPVTIIREHIDLEVLQEDAICTKKLIPVSTIPEIKFSPPDLLAWAKSKGYSVPKELEYLLPRSALTKQERIKRAGGENKKLRPSTRIKMSCQEVARALWRDNPEMTIVDMAKHQEIQEKGAKNYSDKIVRTWLSEVDPRPLEIKTGRPRKK